MNPRISVIVRAICTPAAIVAVLGLMCLAGMAGAQSRFDEGRIELAVVDASDLSGHAVEIHLVRSDGSRRRLDVSPEDRESFGLTAGAWVRVWGKEQLPDQVSGEGAILLQSAEGHRVEVISQADIAAAATVGDQAVALIVLRFADPGEPVSKAEAEQDAQEFVQFYSAVSRNRLRIRTQIFHYQDYPALQLHEPPTCNFGQIITSGNQAARDSGIDIDTFPRRMFFVPRNRSCTVGVGEIAGAATLGGAPAYVWINGLSNLRVNAHELGHTLTLSHSNFVNCNGVPLLSERRLCGDEEYGNEYSAMGGGQASYFSPQDMEERLGWMRLQVAREPGNVFDIRARGLEDSSGLRVIVPGHDDLFVEAVRPILPIPVNYDRDFIADSVINGALITLAGRRDATGLNKTYLLSMGLDRTDAGIKAGRFWRHPSGARTITTIESSPAGVKVRVDSPETEDRMPPQVAFHGAPLLKGKVPSSQLPNGDYQVKRKRFHTSEISANDISTLDPGTPILRISVYRIAVDEAGQPLRGPKGEAVKIAERVFDLPTVITQVEKLDWKAPKAAGRYRIEARALDAFDNEGISVQFIRIN